MEVLFQTRRIHFVGIGGMGMSAIAEILLKMGYPVQGSDAKRSPQTERLQRLGATIFIGHKGHQVDQADVIVFTSACDSENPEIIRARELKIPVIRRAEMLAELMRLQMGVAIAGAHGKTTTTSMIGQITHEAGLDPTVIIGGILQHFESNAYHGSGKLLIAEADESDGSFLHLNPAFAVVTNMDREHLNHYGSMKKLKDTFLQFLEKVPFYGASIICMECPILQTLFPKIHHRVRTYGFSPNVNYSAQNLVKKGWGYSFEVFEALSGKESHSLGEFRLRMGGRHNVLNSLAAIATCRELEVPLHNIRAGLENFAGVDRRLQTLISEGPVVLVDDYGHHPTEIEATLAALREHYRGRIVTLFQPHRFTRTQSLWRQFSSCFSQTDVLFLMDIYAASEPPMEGIHTEVLAESIRAMGHRATYSLSGLNKEAILERLLTFIRPGDILLTLGAGSTSDYAQTLKERLTREGLGYVSSAPVVH